MIARPGRVLWRANRWFRVLRYGFCPDEEAFEREKARVLKAHHITLADEYPVSETTHGITLTWKEDGVARALVCLHESLDYNPIKLVETIAHECVHVAARIIEAMCEKKPGEEFQAYLVGALVGELFEDFRSARRKEISL